MKDLNFINDESDELNIVTEDPAIYPDSVGDPENGEKTGSSKDEKPESKKAGVIREILEIVKIASIALLIGFFLIKVVVMNAEIPSGSMENTVAEGSRVIGLRTAYLFSDPERGDIVIFKYPDSPSTEYLKRVIGLPGDKVEIVDGVLYVNDEIVEEDYLKEPMIGSYGPYYVPEGYYFMLGDNRNSSKDSRFWENTFVARDQIEAKVYFTYYPEFDWLY